MTKLLSILAALFAVTSLTSQVRYVSLQGDDDNDGTSIANAWGSIQHAMDMATPGTTVNILGGVYNEKVYVNVDGEAGNEIVFRSMPGEQAIIDGNGLTDPAMIEMYDVEHVVIEGLHIRNNIQNDAMGILIEGLCSNISIIDCRVEHIDFSADPNATVNENTNSQPIIVYGTETTPISALLIEGCEVYDCRTGYSEALAINGNVEGFVVRNNHVHDITNIGIDIIGHEGTCSDPNLDQAREGEIIGNEVHHCLSPYAAAAGIYVDGGASLLIERNRVHHNQWGMEIGCENVGKTSSSIEVRNNLVYLNELAGMAAGGYDYPDGSGHVTNLAVRNNTFYSNDLSGDFIGELALSYLEQSSFRQNIFYAANVNNVLMYADEGVPALTSVNFDWNLWYHPAGAEAAEVAWQEEYYTGFNEYLQGTTLDANAQFADPIFWNATTDTPDLHIESDSPAREAAEPGFFGVDGELDIDGEVRANGMMDVGADEWYVTTGVSAEVLPQLNVYPNPTSGTLRFDQAIAGREWHLYGVNGQLIATGKVLNAIDLGSLEVGIYYLKVEGFAGCQVLKY